MGFTQHANNALRDDATAFWCGMDGIDLQPIFGAKQTV